MAKLLTIGASRLTGVMQRSYRVVTKPHPRSHGMTTEAFRIDLLCRVDEVLSDVPNHPQAKLDPRDRVTLAVRCALTGVGSRAGRTEDHGAAGRRSARAALPMVPSDASHRSGRSSSSNHVGKPRDGHAGAALGSCSWRSGHCHLKRAQAARLDAAESGRSAHRCTASRVGYRRPVLGVQASAVGPPCLGLQQQQLLALATWLVHGQ